MFHTDRPNSIYRLIKINNGAEALGMARRLERVALTEVCYKLHLTFLHECKDTKQLPSFLKPKPPVDHRKAWKIAERTSWSYLRVLISSCHNTLQDAGNESKKLYKEIEQTVDPKSLNMLRESITNRCLHEKVGLHKGIRKS